MSGGSTRCALGLLMLAERGTGVGAGHNAYGA